MSTLAVAKKDFQDALRSKALWGLSVVFILLSLLIAYVFAEFTAMMEVEEQTAQGLAYFLASQIGLFVSITAIVIAYKAIAGERESGSIKILLSLPHTRQDVLLGKVLGRSATLAVPTLIGLVAGAALGSVLMGEFAIVSLSALLVMSLLFVVTYISIMVGISALAGSTSRASMLTIGFFLVFEILWSVVSIGIVWLTNGLSLPTEFPNWVYLVNQVPPSAAFTTGLTALMPGDIAGVGTPDFEAFYATPWVGVAMLAFWLVVPLAIGYWRFSTADL
ncbi:Nitrite-nitrate reduction protein [Halorhabdus tiamatea SARL4B]|uniref:ABC-2 type transporter, permease protein n=1 Tax=Halorhabdus tiamatea SARL4B TaxID=1033806 RepID=F7PL77_9EURY|nr:ABC transporter permease [Halorhabdus tiamatea]ERJ05832.1 Nitrite-nitrate reduction protein [Halorhabdus tiamatea SARL4B]CCQ34486.1 ABC-2 type transporter, permease protein [Halorhabdus tiamatea SARL4B]